MDNKAIAILIPCYNEEQTVAKVVADFKAELPGAWIYVYDNSSTDNTAVCAAGAGAIVVPEPRRGKGNVVRQMFRDIEADYYVMVDGDDTYPATSVHELLAPIMAGEADMTVGDRLSNMSYHKENKRAFHDFGNNLVRALTRLTYGYTIQDVLTGYRAFNRAFVKGFPILSRGFEIETELTIHAIDKNWRIAQVPVEYRDRPAGSESKLHTFRDGFKVLLVMLSLFKDYRPLALFSILGTILMAAGIFAGVGVIIDFLNTGLVERFPTALLAVALVLVGLLSWTCGLILDTTVKGYRKQYELMILRDCPSSDPTNQKAG